MVEERIAVQTLTVEIPDGDLEKLLRGSLRVDPYDLRRRRRAPMESGPLGLRGLEV